MKREFRSRIGKMPLIGRIHGEKVVGEIIFLKKVSSEYIQFEIPVGYLGGDGS